MTAFPTGASRCEDRKILLTWWRTAHQSTPERSPSLRQRRVSICTLRHRRTGTRSTRITTVASPPASRDCICPAPGAIENLSDSQHWKIMTRPHQDRQPPGSQMPGRSLLWHPEPAWIGAMCFLVYNTTAWADGSTRLPTGTIANDETPGTTGTRRDGTRYRRCRHYSGIAPAMAGLAGSTRASGLRRCIVLRAPGAGS
jgi:hypothetical protein